MGFWDDEVVKAAEENTGGFEAIPEGNYRVMLTNAEVKTTKAGGHYVNAKLELTGNDQYDGRVLFVKFNVDNSNPTAVSIGLGQLKELAAATGKLAWYEDLKTASDWDEAESKLNSMFDALGNIAVEVKVIVKDDPKYGAQNDVKRFKAIAGTTVPPVATKTAAAPKGKKAPWEK